MGACYIIFRPIDKYGHDDVSKNVIIYDSGYVNHIELVKLFNKTWVYKIHRDNQPITYLNSRMYRFTFGVVKL